MKTIPLEFPVTIDGVTLTEVTLDRLKAKHMRRINAVTEQFSQGLEMLSCSSGLPMETVDELDASDTLRLVEAVADFLPSTGSQSST